MGTIKVYPTKTSGFQLGLAYYINQEIWSSQKNYEIDTTSIL